MGLIMFNFGSRGWRSVRGTVRNSIVWDWNWVMLGEVGERALRGTEGNGNI